jgi:hypothetical protein
MRLLPAALLAALSLACSQAAWGAHLIAYCNTAGVVNGTRFTPESLRVPNTSGIDYTGIVW